MTVNCAEKQKAGIYRAPKIYESLNYNDRPEGVNIDTIVLHTTIVSYLEAYRILTAERGVSAHYLVREDGRGDSLVDEAERAWHAGVSSWRGKDNVNDYSIGIEVVNPGSGGHDCFPIGPNTTKSDLKAECQKSLFPKVQIEAVNNLISCLRAAHPDIKNKNIVGHSDIAAYGGRKIDPGVAFPWQELCKRGHGLCSNKDAKENIKLLSLGDRGEAVGNMEYKLACFGYNITQDEYFDIQDAYAVRAFHFHYNQGAPSWGEWYNIDELKLDHLLELSQYEEVAGKCYL